MESVESSKEETMKVAEIAREEEGEDEKVFDDSNSSTASSALEPPQRDDSDHEEAEMTAMPNLPNPPETNTQEEEKEEIAERETASNGASNNAIAGNTKDSSTNDNAKDNADVDVEQGQVDKDHQEEKKVQDSSSLVPTGRSSVDTSGRRYGLIVFFCMCLLVIVILQGVIIGLVVDRNNNDDDNTSDRDFQSETSSPTTASNAPTFSPTLGYIFRSIASNPESIRLDQVSTCDDCSESITFPVGVSSSFLLPWNYDNIISEIMVGSDGYLFLNCYNYGTCGLIHVVALDLAPNVNGDVYILWGEEPRTNGQDHPTTSSTSTNTDHGGHQRQPPPSTGDMITTLTVSWEDVMVYGYWGADPYRVSAQVKIAMDEISFCFGRGNVNGVMFRTGIMNDTRTDNNSYRPSLISGFDANGYSFNFPSNVCEAIPIDDAGWIDDDDDDVGWGGNVPTVAPYSSWPTTAPPWNYNYPTTAPSDYYQWPTTRAPYYTWPTTPAPTNPNFPGFTRIANNPDAIPLDGVSSCDECSQSTRYESFPYLWKGTYQIWEILVNSNGSLELIGDCISPSGDRTCAIINVVSMDLDPSTSASDSNTIWALETSESYVYSFEEVPIFGSTFISPEDGDEYADDAYWTRGLQVYPQQQANVSAQVHLYYDGKVDICWGSMYLTTPDQTFASSIVDQTDGRFYPANGPEFSGMGQSRPYRYPYNTCQTILDAVTGPSPSATFTSSPTMPLPSVSFPQTHSPTHLDRYSQLESILRAYQPLAPLAFDWLARIDAWTPPPNIDSPNDMFIERYTLAAFYFATSGNAWSNRSGWLSNFSVCVGWFGVVCDENQRVQEIDLDENELFGLIPTQMVALRNLRRLSLWDNKVSDGSFPEAVLRLTSLSHLSLRAVGLTGTIPRDIVALQNLDYLNLAGNQFSGTIPYNVFGLTNLRYLNFAQNVNLRGSLPSEIGSLTQLTALYLFNSSLTGSLPTTLPYLYQLEVLHIGRNKFSGTIPSEFPITSLRRLDISDCMLIGSLPTEIALLARLEQLHLDRNYLTGTVPRLPPSLTACNLSENNFSETTNSGICKI